MYRHAFVAVLSAAAFSAACDKKEPTTDTSEAPKATKVDAAGAAGAENADAGSDVTVKPESSWTKLDQTALTPPQVQQLAKASSAQKELGGSLSKALKASVDEKGFAESLEVCRGAAPDMTAKVGAKHGLKIGRTSLKLRNPGNLTPEWAKEAVAAEKVERQVFAGPNGVMGVAGPILIQTLCVNCHGPAGQLAKGVPEALKEKYPADKAIDYSVGDLRGWFWIEVPGS